MANDKADELAGLQPGELVGLTDEAFLPPEELELSRLSFQRVVDERTSHEREDSVEIGGELKTFKSTRFPLRDEGGEITAVGGISVDITPERAAAQLRDELSATQQNAIEELQLSRQETIEGLTKAIGLHDSSTGEHVDRMAALASFLAARIGCDADQVRLLRAAAPMHDVGKIRHLGGDPLQGGASHRRGARGDGAPHGCRPQDLRPFRKRPLADRR